MSQEAPRVGRATVEAVVRGQLSDAFGGVRGVIETAVPTLLFTIVWLSTRELQLGLVLSLGAAVILLVARLVQRSTVQFCVNALVGIGIGMDQIRDDVLLNRQGTADERSQRSTGGSPPVVRKSTATRRRSPPAGTLTALCGR